MRTGGEVELQVVRTVPEKIYRRLPRGDFSILESYLGALKSAQRLIFLENQFLWSPEVAAVLADKLRQPPDPEFRLLLVLPAKPNSGDDDTRGVLGELIEQTTTTDGCSPAPCTPAPARSPTRSTFTQRSRSSTTAGSRSVPPT